MDTAPGMADHLAADRCQGSPSPAERAMRIRVLLGEISTRMRTASRLVIAATRMFYDSFMAACLIAAALVIIGGKPLEALVWGGTGVASALGWMAAKLASRGVVRLRRALREEWAPPADDLSRRQAAPTDRGA